MAARSRRGRVSADPARVAAFRALMAVESEGAYANLAVSEAISRAQLTGRDAAFATELTDGTARGLGTWDAVLAAASGRRPADLQPAVRTVLRMACHQILATRVPARAAVDTSVTLARTQIGERVTGLVNAVARRIGRHDLPGWAAELGGDPLEVTALRTLHPRWIVEEFTRLLGADEAVQALAADNIAPVPTLVVRPGLAEVAELLGAGATACRYSPYGATRPGNPGQVPAVAEGRAGVQDEGSQLVALALARAADQDPSDSTGTWLDLCSGPGGKAALLAGLAARGNRGLVACEIHPHRAAMVARALAPLPGAHQIVVADGRRPPWATGAFAAVLADVPCSGLGSLRRRPESRWRREPGDLQELQGLQKELLRSAVTSAAPGAVIGYITCSPAAAETLEVTGWALENLPVDLLDAPAVLPEVPDAATGPHGRCLQLWPHRHGTDSMFCALLRRR